MAAELPKNNKFFRLNHEFCCKTKMKSAFGRFVEDWYVYVEVGVGRSSERKYVIFTVIN